MTTEVQAGTAGQASDDRLDRDRADGANTPAATHSPAGTDTFRGFVRGDGRIGTRNVIAVICTVNCAATTVRKVAAAFTPQRLAAFANVDGVVALVHELGCGMEQTGEPMDLLRRTIAGYVRNANVAGAVLIGLGCERNGVDGLIGREQLQTGPLLHRLVMQEGGGTMKTVEAGIAAVESMLPLANAAARQPVPAAGLVLALQSTGEDALSPLTANPALGHAVDRLIAAGGTAVLTATSSVAGVARALIDRAASKAIGDQLGQRIAWWDRYTDGTDTRFRRNAAAAAVAVNAAELRASQTGNLSRAGSQPLSAVIEYAHPVPTRGLVFMDGPAYEAVSATGQIASGATVVCLSTGSGSGYGSTVAPVLKLASSTELFEAQDGDLDIDCGPVARQELTVQQMGDRIYAQILSVASGQRTSAEEIGLGDDAFVPWPIGKTA